MKYEVVGTGDAGAWAVYDPKGDIEYDLVESRELAVLIAEVLNEESAPEDMTWDDVEAVLREKAATLKFEESKRRELLARFG